MRCWQNCLLPKSCPNAVNWMSAQVRIERVFIHILATIWL